MVNESPIIQVKNLVCAYGDNVIIDDISFDIKKGERFIILGGSGCGKTTVLKHLIGLYAPARGSIFIKGQDFGNSKGKNRADILQSFGVMYQMGALFGSMTLLENVRLPLEEFTDMPLDAMNYCARMKLSLVGLEDSADKMPSELSGGMLKRGAIARAMALDPEILFLDEPGAGLDPITSAELDDLVINLSNSLNVTFVIVTHELASIYAVADQVLMLDKSVKGIIAQGDPEKLREQSTNPIVKQFFNRESGTKVNTKKNGLEVV